MAELKRDANNPAVVIALLLDPIQEISQAIPAAIAAESKRTIQEIRAELADVQQVMDTTAEAATKELQAGLAKAGIATAGKMAAHQAAMNKWRWTALTLTLAWGIGSASYYAGVLTAPAQWAISKAEIQELLTMPISKAEIREVLMTPAGQALLSVLKMNPAFDKSLTKYLQGDYQVIEQRDGNVCWIPIWLPRS